MNNRCFGFLLLAGMTSIAANANAGSDSGLYIGGSIGSADVDYSESSPDFGDVSFDSDDTGYKVFGGYNFGIVPFLNLAAELSYVDFGSQESLVAGVTGNRLDVNAFTLAGLLGFDLGPVGVFAKAGFARWDADLKSGFGNGSESGSDPLYGLGAKIQLGSIAVRAEYEMYDLDNVEIDYFSLGASYTF